MREEQGTQLVDPKRGVRTKILQRFWRQQADGGVRCGRAFAATGRNDDFVAQSVARFDRAFTLQVSERFAQRFSTRLQSLGKCTFPRQPFTPRAFFNLRSYPRRHLRGERLVTKWWAGRGHVISVVCVRVAVIEVQIRETGECEGARAVLLASAVTVARRMWRRPVLAWKALLGVSWMCA